MVSSAAMRSLLLVLLPAVGLARAGSEPSPSPAPEDSQAELDSLPAPPLTSADVPPRSARLLVDPYRSTAHGWVGMLVGGLSSGVVGAWSWLSVCLDLDGASGDCSFLGLIAPNLAAAALTASIVSLSGVMLDGHGNFFAALLGAAVPAAVGALLMSGRGADERRVIPGFFLLALGTPAGALLGYSVAHTPAMVPAEGQASGTLRLMPAVGVTRDGIGLGLHGRF